MRRAIDTNIIVRLFAKDHSQQWERADAVLRTRTAFIPSSVVLETEWVLRSVFGFDRTTIASLLSALIRLPSVEIEKFDRIDRALDMFAGGLDFADALHLSLAEGCEELLTFDTGFIRKARDFPDHAPVRQP